MGRKKTVPDDELLRHAREVFLARGRAGSTKEVAKRAGISEAVLFQRFKTKRELVIAALHPTPVDVNEALKLDALSQDFRIGLAQLGRRMLAVFNAVIPATMQLITSFGVSPEEIFAKHSARAPVTGFVDGVARYIADAETRGEVSATNPVAAAGLFVAAIHSLAVFELMGMHGHSGAHGDAAIDSFVAVLWAGLAGKTAGGRP